MRYKVQGKKPFTRYEVQLHAAIVSDKVQAHVHENGHGDDKLH